MGKNHRTIVICSSFKRPVLIGTHHSTSSTNSISLAWIETHRTVFLAIPGMGALLQLVGDALSIHFVNCSCSTSIDNSSRSQHITGSKTRRNGCADHSDTAVLGRSQFYRAFNGFQWVLSISNMTPLRSWNFDAVSGMGHFKRLMPSIASLTCFDFLLYLLSLIIHRLFFCHLFEKHVELPGRNLVQLRDRRAVGDNWREDFIQDCWSLRIGIVTSLILR